MFQFSSIVFNIYWYVPAIYTKNQQPFSTKGLKIDILGFAGHIWTLSDILCFCGVFSVFFVFVFNTLNVEM